MRYPSLVLSQQIRPAVKGEATAAHPWPLDEQAPLKLRGVGGLVVSDFGALQNFQAEAADGDRLEIAFEEGYPAISAYPAVVWAGAENGKGVILGEVLRQHANVADLRGQ